MITSSFSKLIAVGFGAVCFGLPLSAAEPVPFQVISDQAKPTEFFYSAAGLFYSLDGDQRLAWLFNEGGKFEGLIGYSLSENEVTVLRNGVAEFSLPANKPASPVQYEGFDTTAIADVRPVFQQLVGSQVQRSLADVLVEGAKFTNMFTIEAPDGSLKLWWPDYAARGIYVERLEDGDQRFVFLDDLVVALDLQVGGSDAE